MRTWGSARRFSEAQLFLPREDVVALRRFSSRLAGVMFVLGALAALALGWVR